MNILPIQNDIVSKLNVAFTAASLPFRSFDLPDVPNDVQKAVANPIVFVAYTGSTAEPSMDARVIYQNRKLNFNIEINARRLNGENGMFAARDVVEQVLTGCTPINCGKLYLVKDDINQTDDNVWVHIYQMETQTMLVQKDEQDIVVVPNFTTLNDKTLSNEEV